MASYFSERTLKTNRASGYPNGGYEKSRQNQRGSSEFLSAMRSINDIADVHEENIAKVASIITSFEASNNKKGETNLKAINDELDKLIQPFNSEDQVTILKNVISNLVVNL